MTKNIEEFMNCYNRHFDRSKNSALEIGIRYKNDVQYYSWNNKNNKQHFGLGSISKTFLSTYICEMIKNNEIDLSKTIDYYLPLTQKRRYPTVLALLTHTSGYHAFIPFNRSMWIMIINGFNKKNIYTNMNNKWLLRSVNKKRPFRKKKYRYSDYNYALVALIIEQIKKRPYKDALTDYIQSEIGMMNTYYGSKLSTENDKTSWLWHDDNPFLASGGLFSTIEDMIKFLDYQISNQDLLEPSLQKYHKLNLNKNIFTGFSWNSFYKGKFFWHIGGQGGYRSYALFDVKKDISIIILSTVDKNVQHVNRLGSSLYRNVKRNYSLFEEYLEKISLDQDKK